MTCPPAQTIQGVQDIIYTVINSGSFPKLHNNRCERDGSDFRFAISARKPHRRLLCYLENEPLEIKGVSELEDKRAINIRNRVAAVLEFVVDNEQIIARTIDVVQPKIDSEPVTVAVVLDDRAG